MDDRLQSACESERLHLSGAIQPYGGILAIDQGGTITHASENISAYLGRAAREALGTSWSLYFEDPKPPVPMVLGAQRRLFSVSFRGCAARLDVVFTRSNEGGLIVEATPSLPFLPMDPPRLVEKDPVDLLRGLQKSLPHERILYYQFRYDGDGEVIAESRTSDDIGSYLGLRFPAADIPRVARELYLKNPWRQIPDARQAPVPILSFTNEPLDLSYSDLRSVSPVHCVYLANMRVVASLSFPIVIRGRLEALVACHHRESVKVSSRALAWASDAISQHQIELQREFAMSTLRLIDDAKWRWTEVGSLLGAQDESDQWETIKSKLLHDFAADHVAIFVDGKWLHQDGLPTQFLERLRAWLVSGSSLVRFSENLPGDGLSDKCGQVCGALSIGFGRGELRNWIVLLRNEHIHEVAWGGSPHKPEEVSTEPLSISPRRSFERWVEIRRGHSRPWSRTEHLLALQLRTELQA